MPTEAPEAPASAALRDRLHAAAEKADELRSLPESKRGDTWAADVRNASNEVIDLDRQFNAVRSIEQYDAEAAAWSQAQAEGADPRSRSRGPEGAHDDPRSRGARDAGTELVLSDEYREWNARGGDRGRMPAIDIEGRSFLSPEIRALVDSSTDNSGADAGYFLPVGQPIAPVPRQMRFSMRDIEPVIQTTLAAIPYIRELNPATSELSASSVSEGAAKPEVALDFEQKTALVEKIAAWLPATMEILSDAPLLRGYINTRLAYMLRVRETQQLLSGSGTSPQIQGLLTVSGVQTVDGTENTDGDVPATFATAMGLVENVDGEANGVVMNPVDYWAFVSKRHANQLDGQALAQGGGVPFGAPAPTLWDVPVVRTRAITAETGLVGDFQQGAAIFDRMQTTIRQSDSHDDYFVNNKVAVLAEERITQAVFRPDLFVVVTIDHTA